MFYNLFSEQVADTLKFVFSPDVILRAWLGSQRQPTLGRGSFTWGLKQNKNSAVKLSSVISHQFQIMTNVMLATFGLIFCVCWDFGCVVCVCVCVCVCFQCLPIILWWCEKEDYKKAIFSVVCAGDAAFRCVRSQSCHGRPWLLRRSYTPSHAATESVTTVHSARGVQRVGLHVFLKLRQTVWWWPLTVLRNIGLRCSQNVWGIMNSDENVPVRSILVLL